MVCMMLLVSGMVSNMKVEVKAASDIPMVDGSYLTYDAESIGYATSLTRGVDLLNGYSKVVKLGVEKIYAGGTTAAAHTVDTVKIAVMVERTVAEGEPWEFVDGWQKTNLNADRVSSNRQLNVDGGYYYRVRCTHSANDDVSSSFTDGIYIEEP